MLGRLKGSTSFAWPGLAAAQPVASTSKAALPTAAKRRFCSCGAALVKPPTARSAARAGPSRASSSFPPRAGAERAPANVDGEVAVAEIDQLEQLIQTRQLKSLGKAFEALSPSARLALRPSTFDSLVSLLTATSNTGANWRSTRLLFRFATERRWKVETAQLLLLLRAGVRWVELRKAAAGHGGVAPVDWPMLEQVARQLAQADLGPSTRDEARELISKLAAARLRRFASAQSPAAERQTRPPSDAAAKFAVSVYRLGLSVWDKPLAPFSDLPGTAILTSLLEHHPQRGLEQLHVMLAHNQIPHLDQLATFLVSVTAAAEVDTYAHAREVLDSACASAASGALDRLLEERLERLERERYIHREPMLAFIRWLVEDLPGIDGGPACPRTGDKAESINASEAVEAALRVWAGVYGLLQSDDGRRFENLRALDQLAKDACRLQATAAAEDGANARPPLLTTELALDLAARHLTPPMLANASHTLLNAIAVNSTSSEFAMRFYHSLRTRCSASSPRPFQWHTALRPALASLMLAAEGRGQDGTIVQLYLDWTGDGLVLPADLWKLVWRAAGRRSQVEEIMRLVNDYEEAGRGKVPARIVALVMHASAGERRIVKTLRLLSYWRSRTRNVGSLGGGRSDVPLEAYEAVLDLLSTSNTDRRAAGMNVFQGLLDEGHKPTTRTWNFLLAAQVFRPMFHIEDVDNAGRAFNSLIGAGCKPDARTYSLLTYGFLRLASSRREKSAVGLHAALKTFNKATNQGFALNGTPVARLVKALAQVGRFEEAKEINEAWWRVLGEDVRGRRGEMDEVRNAAEMVEWTERKALARAQVGGSTEEEDREKDWPEVEERAEDDAPVEIEGEATVDVRSPEAFGRGVKVVQEEREEKTEEPFSFTSTRPERT